MFFYLSILLPVACVGSFLWYLQGNETNHTGMEFLLLLVPFLICAIISAVKIPKKKLFLLPFLLNITSMGFFYVIDHYNIMVEYGRWTKRGMPERFGKALNRLFKNTLTHPVMMKNQPC